LGSIHTAIGARRRIAQNRATSDDDTERGVALAATLVITVVAAAVVLAISQYVSTGLRRTTSVQRNLSTAAAAESAVNWYVEELTYKRIAVCGAAAANVVIPQGVPRNSASVSLSCQRAGTKDGLPVVELVATASRTSTQSTITATVQVSNSENRVALLTWSAT
jgi:Tfp pilus assembly protein PilX